MKRFVHDFAFGLRMTLSVPRAWRFARVGWRVRGRVRSDFKKGTSTLRV